MNAAPDGASMNCNAPDRHDTVQHNNNDLLQIGAYLKPSLRTKVTESAVGSYLQRFVLEDVWLV